MKDLEIRFERGEVFLESLKNSELGGTRRICGSGIAWQEGKREKVVGKENLKQLELRVIQVSEESPWPSPQQCACE